jgi:hypothetical protein
MEDEDDDEADNATMYTVPDVLEEADVMTE